MEQTQSYQFPANALIWAARGIGRRVRALRGQSLSFHAECTDLTLDRWHSERFPDVAFGQAASDCVRDALCSGGPTMVCRFGTTELSVISAAVTPLTLANLWKVASGDDVVFDIGLHKPLIAALCRLSGFFPIDMREGHRFVRLMLADMKEIDVLAVWCKQEAKFNSELAAVRKIRFRDLEPYLTDQPWSSVLAGKKVLVIHPFARTIISQYETKRHLLFANPLVLPEFQLRTIKAVQSIADNETPFRTWFDALEAMKQQIEAEDFDVALIGCGAYGMPLAAHVKRIGRKAVHMGGQTQLLFGIKGKRWETGHEEIRRLFNAHWVYPDEGERPRGFTNVEGGAYW